MVVVHCLTCDEHGCKDKSFRLTARTMKMTAVTMLTFPLTYHITVCCMMSANNRVLSV